MTTLRHAARRWWGALVLGVLALGAARPLHATDGPSTSDDLLLHEHAEPFKAFADRVVAVAATGDAADLARMFSPTVVKANGGEDALRAFVEQWIMPFFAEYASTVPETSVTPTQLPNGPSGFALYKSIREKDGTSKPFVLYVLRENGTLVVGSVLLGKTYRDLHPES